MIKFEVRLGDAVNFWFEQVEASWWDSDEDWVHFHVSDMRLTSTEARICSYAKATVVSVRKMDVPAAAEAAAA